MLGGVDAVVFDNVMSLLVGDQKDEMTWSGTLPLVSGLTRRNIGERRQPQFFEHVAVQTRKEQFGLGQRFVSRLPCCFHFGYKILLQFVRGDYDFDSRN